MIIRVCKRDKKWVWVLEDGDQRELIRSRTYSCRAKAVQTAKNVATGHHRSVLCVRDQSRSRMWRWCILADNDLLMAESLPLPSQKACSDLARQYHESRQLNLVIDAPSRGTKETK